MGANATTFVPAYVAGEVLTAADLSVTNSGIPVFATTTTRDAAFGGTGEKVLAEGQFAYIEATNTTQYYDGAAWQSVGVTPGMVRVGGASFTTTASVQFANDTFTTAYSTYYVVVNITASSTDQTFSLRVRNNSGAVTGSNYYGNSYFIRAANATLTANNTSALTSQALGYLRNVSSQSFSMWVTQPANASVITRWWGQAAAFDSGFDPAANTMAGNYYVNEAHTGLNFFVTGTISGTYSVYALAES